MGKLGNKKDWQRRQRLLNKWIQIVSVMILLAYGVVSLIVGIILRSWWYISLSIYYLLLWYMEASITKNIARRRHRQAKLEYRRMRQIGVAILILNFVLIGIVILAIVLGRRVHYPGITIHITAIYDIVVVILAAYGASILVRRIVVGIVGGAICVINILLARHMIRLGNGALK